MRRSRTARARVVSSRWCSSASWLTFVCACSGNPSGSEAEPAGVEARAPDLPESPAVDREPEGESPGAASEASAGAPPVSEAAPSEISGQSAGGSSSSGAGGESPADEGQAGSAQVPPGQDAPEAGGSGGESTGAGPVTLYLAGDSTVQTYADTASERDQAGWGQMLGAFVSGDVRVDNRAIGGRTARRFIDEGRLDDLVDDLLPGDYLLVQFGTNDGNRTATYTIGEDVIPYFLDPGTDFKTYLQRYVDAARSRSATAVLVTPPPRNSAYCTGGNGTGAHAEAMRELGRTLGIGVVDLNASTVAHLRAICPAPTPEDFFLLRADGSVDGTHFQENGARILASFVAGGLASAAPDLASAISDAAPRSE